jgi:hypothetical protein
VTHTELLDTIERLCEVIETSIREGSTIVESPVAVKAREQVARLRREVAPRSGTIPAGVEV